MVDMAADACLRVRGVVGEVVEPLGVSVPLHPAEFLHHPLCCFGQTLWIDQHLIHTHICA